MNVLALSMPVGHPARVLLIVLSSFAAAPAAWAGLGEPLASLARDREALHATASSVAQTERYERHEFATEQGGRVREYVNAAGTVFAVAWSGPVAPDLRTILGASYDTYVAAAQNHRGSHHVFSMADDSLVLTITRAPRGFSGMAHLPALLPAGVDAQSLR